MATLQKFKLLDEQEQQYNRTGKVNALAIQQAGITQLDYQQYEASKREYQKTGQVDFTKYTSDPTKGIYGGVDTNQFDKDALDLTRMAWKETYTASTDKGFAYDMSDPDDVQNMLSGRMSKAVASSYDIDEMNQWLYREGLPNSQHFGALYNAALEEVAEQRRLTENDKAFDSAVMNALMEKSKAGVVIDDKAVREAIVDVRATDPEKYDEVEERLYKETGLLASKSAGYLAEAQGMNAQMEEAAQSGREGGFLRNALLDAGAMLAGTPFASLAFTPPESEEEPERPLTEVDLKAQEIVGPFKLPEFEPIPFNVKEASPEEKRQAAEAKERRELERNGRSEAEINAHIASLSEEDWARRIGRMEASGYGDENVFKAQQEDAYREKKQEAAQGAYDALRAAGFSASEASIYLEQNGLDYADTAVYREAETARRASQDEGSTYLKQRAAEDGMENAGKDLHSYVSPDWSDMAASRREKEVVWAQAMRQELIDKGYSPLEADNILAVNNLDVALDKRQTAEDYERYILSVYGLDDASINDYITNLTDEEWEQRIKSLKFNDMLETGSYEQAERMLYSIPVRAALGVATGVVGVADMAANGIEALITGEEQDMWKSTKYLLEQSGKWAAYGHDINHPVMSAASDIGSEILRMYALGAAGGALGGLTEAGTSTLLSTAASQAPFVASSMGTYYTQARMSGANQSEATLSGVVGGTVEGLLESAATSEILNQAFTNKIMTKAITNAATPLKTRMLLAKYGTPAANILASMIGEFGEEAASEVISGLLRTSIWDSSYETQLSDVGESGAMGAAIGFFMAALGAPATSRRNQMAMQMMDAQSSAIPMDLQMFGEMYDNLVAATITESLKPETLTLVQKDAALQSAPTVADMIAQIQQDNAHISAEGVRHKRRLEALTEDVEKARSKVNRYVTAFKKLDPNSPDYATRWGELRGQIDSARDNFEQITASSLSKREAAAEEHAALVSRLQNDVARTSDKLTRHFVARDAAARAEQPAEPIEAGISVEPPEMGTPPTVAQPADVAQPITDLGANTPPVSPEGIVSQEFRDNQSMVNRAARNFYRAFVDGSAELGNVAKAQRQAQSGTAMVDDLAQLYRTAGGTVDYLLETEQVDAYGNPTGRKGFKQIWEDYPDISGEEINQYMLHLHNIDRMREGKPIFANEDGTPVTAEQSQEIVRQMGAANPALKNLASEVRQWHRQFMRDFWVGDMLSEADYAALLAKYPDYVPTYRTKYDERASGTSSTFGGRISMAAPIKMASGDTSEVVDIRDSFADSYNRMVRARRKNDLLLNLYNFAQANPAAAAPFARITDAEGALDATVNMPMTLDDLVAESFMQAQDGQYSVRLRKNGEWAYMNVSQDVFGGISDLFSRQYNEWERWAMEGGKRLTGLQKALITGYNPFFAIRNFARDTQTAFINEEKLDPVYFMGSIGKAAKLMQENSPEFKRFKALGGDRSGFFKSNEGLIRSAGWDTQEQGIGASIKKGANWVKDKTSAIGEYSETLNRFATALRYIDQHGNTDADWQAAMLASAEGTTNFARSGPLTKVADAACIYLNANVQGTDKVLRQVVNHPGKTLGKTFGIAMAGVLLGKLVGNDENEHYQNLSRRIRDNYFCIPNVFGDRDSNGYCTTFIRIPKAQGYATIIAAFQRASEMVTQDAGFNEAYDGFMDSAMESLTIDPSVPLLGALSEASKNESWSGATIEPAYMKDYLTPEKYAGSTSQIAVNISRVMDTMGVEWSPMRIDYVLDQATGIAGDIILPAAAVSNDSAGSAAKSVGDVLARQFVADPLFSNDAVSKFYEADEDISIARKQAKDERDAAFLPDQYKGYDENRYTAYDKAKSELNETYKEERNILNTTPNTAQRDKRIKEIRQRRLDIIERFNEEWPAK